MSRHSKTSHAASVAACLVSTLLGTGFLLFPVYCFVRIFLPSPIHALYTRNGFAHKYFPDPSPKDCTWKKRRERGSRSNCLEGGWNILFSPLSKNGFRVSTAMASSTPNHLPPYLPQPSIWPHPACKQKTIHGSYFSFFLGLPHFARTERRNLHNSLRGERRIKIKSVPLLYFFLDVACSVSLRFLSLSLFQPSLLQNASRSSCLKCGLLNNGKQLEKKKRGDERRKGLTIPLSPFIFALNFLFKEGTNPSLFYLCYLSIP